MHTRETVGQSGEDFEEVFSSGFSYQQLKGCLDLLLVCRRHSLELDCQHPFKYLCRQLG